MGPTSLRVRAGLEEVIEEIGQVGPEEVTDVDEAGLEEVAEDIDNVLGAGLGARTHSQPVHLCLHIWFQSE